MEQGGEPVNGDEGWKEILGDLKWVLVVGLGFGIFAGLSTWFLSGVLVVDFSFLIGIILVSAYYAVILMTLLLISEEEEAAEEGHKQAKKRKKKKQLSTFTPVRTLRRRGWFFGMLIAGLPLLVVPTPLITWVGALVVGGIGCAIFYLGLYVPFVRLVLAKILDAF